MALTKHMLGEFIERIDRRNSDLKYGIDDVRGVSNTKEIQPTKADISTRSFARFQIVREHEFVFNRRTTRMGEKIGLGYNNIGKTFIVTEDYVVFRVSDESILLPDYLNVFFRRPEFDRYARWDSWGSATEFFNWEEMCDVPIAIPPLPIQQKYVNVYNAMLANQRVYESGLEDLKLTCDAYIENLRRETLCELIKPYIGIVTESNTAKKHKHVQGVESSGCFMDTRAKMAGVDISKYTVVTNNDIAFNPSRINLGSIALYKEQEPCIVSPMYQVFRITDRKKLLPEYLMMWFARDEFKRYTWFYSSGSVRDTFDYNLMQEIAIPIPSIRIQQYIVNIYTVYQLRREINEQLKAQIKDICPILIKGSIEEATNA